MRRIPSIVSMDCTQECVLQDATTAIERASYRPTCGSTGRCSAAPRRSSRRRAGRRTRCASMYPDCATPVHVMPNPVLLRALRSRVDRARGRRAPRAGAKPRFLFIGGDFPRKGGFDLLDAWQAGRFHEARRARDWSPTGPCPCLAACRRAVTRNIEPHSAGVARLLGGGGRLRDADPERGVRPGVPGSGRRGLAGDRHAAQRRAGNHPRRRDRPARAGPAIGTRSRPRSPRSPALPNCAIDWERVRAR